jgi:glutaminyl-peptide cyclotransferase
MEFGQQKSIAKRNLIFCFITGILFSGCGHRTDKKPATVTYDNTVPIIDFKVINIFPHDTTSYTEGFLFHAGEMFESTGHTSSFTGSRSLFGIVDQHSGTIRVKAEIDPKKYFGEGIAFVNDRIYQLTDTTHIGFIYRSKDYRKIGNFYYDGEGWGLTSNGSSLIMSNGSNNIYYRNPSSLKITKTLSVSDNNGPVPNLNELELINGYLYANQWLTDYILKIDTLTGKVVAKLDLTVQKKEVLLKYPAAQETNGIAFNPLTDKIYVTGKNWPLIFEIAFTH